MKVQVDGRTFLNYVSEFLQPTENMDVFWGFRICPGNGIMEWWNAGILVFKRIIAIFILSSIPTAAGPLIQHCIIPEPIIPLFHYSNCERSELSSSCFIIYWLFNVTGIYQSFVILFTIMPPGFAIGVYTSLP